MSIRKNIYLLDTPAQNAITGSKLPSKKQVLSFFMYQVNVLKKTNKDSAAATIEAIKPFWEKARIPMSRNDHAAEKVLRYYAKWKSVRSGSYRNISSQTVKENQFRENLDDLFDVAHIDALKIITIEEDRLFLLAQREKGRRGTMTGVDLKLTAQENRILYRKSKEEARKQKELKRKATQFLKICPSMDDLGEDMEDISDQSLEIKPEYALPDSLPSCSSTETILPNVKRMKRARQSVVNLEVATALDRANLSDRMATLIIASIVRSLGHSIDDFNINRSSIKRDRENMRSVRACTLREKFSPIGKLTVHWDGKLMQDIVGRNIVDRLPVLVSGPELKCDQLLGIPKLFTSKGKEQAETIHNSLIEWNLSSKVEGICADTTASNTGCLNGACILLQQKLGKELLFYACRHHIYEIVLGAVFECSVESSVGPEVSIFKNFRNVWSKLNIDHFTAGCDDTIVKKSFGNDRETILGFVKEQLQVSQPRDDYRELLDLVCVFLGDVQYSNYKFRTPGALHHARWMSKALYCIKIFMFRKQFQLSSHKLTGIRNVCIFIVKLYVQAWFTTCLPICAPNNDLNFLKSLIDYASVNNKISVVAREKFAGHLWYLNEELVALSFYDNNVSLTVKKLMVKALKEKLADINDSEIQDLSQRVKINLNCHNWIKIWKEKNLFDFVTPKTSLFFKRYGLSTAFMDFEPNLWPNQDDYIQGRKLISKLKVVNDVAERDVALITQYNKCITKNEDKKQELFLVVKDHRQLIPNMTKTTVSAANFDN